MTKVRNLLMYFKYYYLTCYTSNQNCVQVSLLYINVRCVGLKQAKALMFASKFAYKTFMTTYMTSAMSSTAKRVTEQKQKKKVEYHNSDVGNVCNSLQLWQHRKTQ